MNELALFAGAGGGILGGKLLGWRTVCAVEWEAYPASVLCARQNDGLLPTFPIWDDVQTFDGKPWAGIVDVVSGGFPCQDISAAGGGQALMENEAECGEKWRGSFVKYDPDTSLWRTHQCSLLGDLEEFLETWPQWGLMRNGECWEQRTLEHHIKETVFGFYVPTPTSSDGTSGAVIGKNDQFYSTRDGKPRKINQKGNDGAIGLGRLVKMWPTPDASPRGPTKDYNPKAKSQSGRSLQSFAAKFPTPQASDHRDRGNMSNPSIQRRVTIGKQIMLSQSVDLNSGQLNPTWVEWLMGWPLGWTDLKPLEMDKSHCAPQQHGES